LAQGGFFIWPPWWKGIIRVKVGLIGRLRTGLSPVFGTKYTRKTTNYKRRFL